MRIWKHVIFHVDLDCFFASVHIKYRSFLKGLPVIIGANPLGGKGRGVVSTCSYEARSFGIKSGMPISQAYKLCPNAIYICSRREENFPSYYEESSKVLTILEGYSDKFQAAGIDEAYIDVTDIWRNYGPTPEALAKDLQRRIKTEVNLPVSIGIAETKSIAKIASDLNKPNGITIVNNLDLKKEIYHLPVHKIVGIGKKTEERLNRKGIRSIGDIAEMSREKIFLLLGDYGLYLHRVVLGQNFREVKDFYGERKSISSEKTFITDRNNWNDVYKNVKDIVSKLVIKIKKDNLLTRTVSIKIRFQGYITYTRSYTYKNFLAEEKIIYNTAIKLLDEFCISDRKIRLIGVRLSSLKRNKGQFSLNYFLKQPQKELFLSHVE